MIMVSLPVMLTNLPSTSFPVWSRSIRACIQLTNTRFKFDGDRCACASQWAVTHRLAHDGGFTDFLHQGRYLDVWEKREGEWKLLHRVMAGDLDRWVHTLNIQSALDGPNDPLRRCRGDKDPGYLWFDLLNHKPERPPTDDVWTGFHAISKADRAS